MASERRRKKREEESGAYWMDTYGDMITLLLTFFVMLFAFSTIDAQKWESFLSAFSDTDARVIIPALSLEDVLEDTMDMELRSGETDEETSGGQADSAVVASEEDIEQFLQLYQNVLTFVEQNDINALVEPSYETLDLTIRFEDNVFFESGSAELREEAIDTLDQVIDVLAENIDLIRTIKIEGHTDNVPISNSRYQDNWDLASGRANNALRYIQESGRVDSKKLSAVGWGEEHPVADNDTDEGRAQNRRIDFIVESNT